MFSFYSFIYYGILASELLKVILENDKIALLRSD